jgi:ribose 5-phosphate isomerase B
MRIVLASDHRGVELKEFLKKSLLQAGHTVEDVGTFGTEPVDYPLFARKAVELIRRGEAERGILICGTGIGMSIAANRQKGIRAALVQDTFSAAQSRRHLDANVLVLGGMIVGKELAEEIVRVWLETPFEGGRHERRIRLIEEACGRQNH